MNIDYLCITKRDAMFDDFENLNDRFNSKEDDEINEAVKKYQEMASFGTFHFLESDEYEMVVDYFIAENALQKAEQAINEALVQYPSQKVSFELRLAICYASSNREQKALDLLSEIETLDPQNADILLTKGAIYSQLQRYEKAIEEYKKALQDYDELDEVFYSIAQEYQNLGQMDKAIEYLKKSLQANQENESALFELSMVYELSEKPDDAALFFADFANKNPMNHIAWFCLGMAYSNINLYEKSILAFDYCIALDEFFLSAYLNKSNAQNSICDYLGAIETYQEALLIDPDNSYILYCIGESYLDLAELDVAESYLLKSIQLSDLLPDAWFSLASVYEEKSEVDKAISCIKKAIDLDPDNVDFLEYLARIYHISNQTEDAILYYNKALKLLPENIDSWIDLAELYFTDLEDKLKANELLEECLIQNPAQHNEIYTRMGIYALLKGDLDSAKIIFLAIDSDFDVVKRIIDYDDMLFENPNFINVIDIIKPHE